MRATVTRFMVAACLLGGLLVAGCDGPPPKPKQQAGSPCQTNALPSLDLSNVGDFWKDDKPGVRGDQVNANFQREKAYLGSRGYRGKNKGVEVAVFRSEEDAVKAMESLRDDVASVIVPGDANCFVGRKWWFTSGIPNAVFVNCRNAIITVSCYQPPFDKSEALLKKTAAIVADRIENTKRASNDERGIIAELRFRKKPPVFAVNDTIVVEARFANRTDKPQVYRGGLGLRTIKSCCQIKLMAEGGKTWSAEAAAAIPFANYKDIAVPAHRQVLVGEWDLTKLVYSEGRLIGGGQIPFADIARPGRYRIRWWDGVLQAGTPLWSAPVDFEIVRAANPATANRPQ